MDSRNDMLNGLGWDPSIPGLKVRIRDIILVNRGLQLEESEGLAVSILEMAEKIEKLG